jgi:hypothetical protein
MAYQCITPEQQMEVMEIADEFGVPRSVAFRLQVEETGNPKTGAWGCFDVGSHDEVEGYHSQGLYQLFEKFIKYFAEIYWYGYGETETFDVFNYRHNATVAFRYLADLHKRYGTWYLALLFYNHGNIETASEETKAYAMRIISAPDWKIQWKIAVRNN